MFGLIRRKREELEKDNAEPNPAVAFAVGLIYVFRTAAGAKIMQELETAVRKYAADPQALWQLVKSGGVEPQKRDVIDTTAHTIEKTLGATPVTGATPVAGVGGETTAVDTGHSPDATLPAVGTPSTDR